MSGRAFPCASALALACLLSLSAVSAPRADVVVPDDYPTIQAALDANAGIVKIRTGRYDEVVRLTADAVIEAFDGGSVAAFDYPDLRGLTIAAPLRSLTLTGLRVRQPVAVGGGIYGTLRFEACRFDSGMVVDAFGGPNVQLRGCIVYGGAHLATESLHVYGCTIVGGGLYGSWLGSGWVYGNYITGPAPWGVKLEASAPYGEIVSNVITGTDIGIIPSQTSFVSFNEISSCALDGIGESSSDYDPHGYLVGNHVRDCGRSGIRTRAGQRPYRTIYILRDNRIEGTGEDGILMLGTGELTGNTVLDAGRHGIVADSCVLWMGTHGNAVSRAHGDGMRIQTYGPIDSNIVGHNGGHGLVLRPRGMGSGFARFLISQNTAYGNGGSGIVVEDVLVSDERGTVRDSVQSNLLVANGRYGLEWTGYAVATLGCNDYYANTLGMTAGVAPVLGDMSIEPLLCDMARDDVSLRADSPLLHAPGCGPVGARGVGCAALASAPLTPRSGALAFASAPQPARGGVRFTWNPQGAPARLEVFDVTGARHVDEPLDAARSELVWDGRGAGGHALPAGLYYARLTAGPRAETRTVVLLR